MFEYWIWCWTWWPRMWIPQADDVAPENIVRPQFNRTPREWHREKARVIDFKRAA